MNYQKIYDSLIERARNRVIGGYVEVHHIVPRCIGGSDEKSNLVALTPEEHFLAHVLLVKIFPEERNLIFAVQKMTSFSRDHNGFRKRKLYGWLKRLHSERMSELSSGSGNSQFGTQWINDGTTSKKIKKDEVVPEGWIVGRILNSTKLQRKCDCCNEFRFNKSKYCINHYRGKKGPGSRKYRQIYSDEQIIEAWKNSNSVSETAKKLGFKNPGSLGKMFYRIKELRTGSQETILGS